MSKLRQKTTATLLIAIFMISAFAISAYGIPGTHLTATGTAGTEDRIVIDMPAGFTLGMLNSISWAEYLIAGYPPHVDVILDLDTDGNYDDDDDALVFEYAYNDLTHYTDEAPMPYGAITGAWYATFSDDGNGPAAVDDDAMAWATKGAPGAPPLGGNFYFYSLADWKIGVTYEASGQSEKTIDSDSIVLRLEIEVDNWVIDSEAYVTNIKVNGGSAVSMSATSDGYDLTVSIAGLGSVTPPGKVDCYSGEVVILDAVPAANWHFKGWTGDITSTNDPLSVTMDASKSVTATFELDVLSIGVSPTTVDFGTVIMGEVSSTETMTITNQGNVLLEVNAEVIETGSFFDDYLRINNMLVDTWSSATFEVAIGSPETVGLKLDLTACTTVSTYEGTLVFWAEAA